MTRESLDKIGLEKSQLIINAFNEISKLIKYDCNWSWMYKQICKHMNIYYGENINYNEVREAFLKHIQFDLGSRRTRFKKIINVEKGRQDYAEQNDSIHKPE